MSDKEEGAALPEKPFYVDRAKTGRAACKKCKQKIPQGELRFAKLGYNPFGSGTIKQWHHIPCVFEVFKKQRATTRKIEHPDDIGGWDDLNEDDKRHIMENFTSELRKVFENRSKDSSPGPTQKLAVDENHKDNSFRAFRKLCAELSNDSSYLGKTKIVSNFFQSGSDGAGFKGDTELWCRLLLPGAIVRVYNLQSKQLVKLFSRILGMDQEEMLEDLEKGDVADTISSFFERSKVVVPAKRSTLTLQDVDDFLEKLSKMTKEEEQTHHFTKIVKKCTATDLTMILRLIKHDLRINAGPKHILEGLHKDAYKAFQASRDLKSVVADALKARGKTKKESDEEKRSKEMAIGIKVMTPVLPMLAQACKSAEEAIKKCPNGMFSEIKYDGERVQLHKQGKVFKYFSRSLKQVLPHKVDHFKDFIPQAFPHGKDLILDAEILMVDNATGKPLPFGTLGIHKKSKFENANVCLFVFDCMYYNGESLLETSLKERKDVLRKNMVEVKNHIMLSEMEEIHKTEDLEKMMTKVFKEGLEGLVLKDTKSKYEPGKRHWLKMKRDYLFDGAMADSADLVVLGAWFGTGSKGGIMSSFLMGCYDESSKKWVTVTKVSGGHDDNTLERLQKELKMIKISKDANKVPRWLDCTKTMVPDFVAQDPKKMPVWEITGAEFTRNQVHTADGISIRFPRVTKIRDDKDWSSATNLKELNKLYEKSKDTSSFSLDKFSKASCEAESSDDEKTSDSKKRKHESKKKGNTDVEDDEKPSECKKRKRETKEEKPKKAKMKEDDQKAYQQDTDTEDELDDHEFMESDIANPLPDIFSDCVIQMPKDYRNYDFLRRYLIAYGAVLRDADKNTWVENSSRKVTHVVHLKKVGDINKERYWAEDVRQVHVNWVWDSIKLLEKQPEGRYVVSAN